MSSSGRPADLLETLQQSVRLLHETDEVALDQEVIDDGRARGRRGLQEKLVEREIRLIGFKD